THACRAWPDRCCGPFALCDIFCERVAAWLFSFRRRSCVRLAGTTATATRTTGTAAIRAVATRRATRTALFFTRGSGFGRQFAVGQHVALVDPDLDADHTIGGVGFGGAVVDIGFQRVKRHTTFAIPL